MLLISYFFNVVDPRKSGCCHVWQLIEISTTINIRIIMNVVWQRSLEMDGWIDRQTDRQIDTQLLDHLILTKGKILKFYPEGRLKGKKN